MAAMPYPDKFYAAVKASKVPATEALFSDETRLLLYALMQQAEEGACPIRSKWGMELEERAKYETWVNLGKMDKFEAMRLYVKLIDEEKPDWWKTVSLPGALPVATTRKQGSAAQCPSRRQRSHFAPSAAAAGRGPLDGSDSEAPADLPAGLADLAPGRWARPANAGARPLPRYQHGAVVAGARLYVVGGSYRGRFMGDTHELDLNTLTWRKLESERAPPGDQLTPCAGHRVVSHDGEVYLVGGRFKAGEGGKYLALMRMELSALGKSVAWAKVETTGPKPGARRGMSATVLGDTLVVFGGEDADRRYVDDAHALDLTTMTWRAIECGGDGGGGGGGGGGKSGGGATLGKFAPPAPRAEHTAAAWGDDKLLVFGGTGASFKCFNSLHVLDLPTVGGRWQELRPKGVVPSPRAGHAGTVYGDRYWCILGGGNNQNGVPDTAVLDLEEMRWVDASGGSGGGSGGGGGGGGVRKGVGEVRESDGRGSASAFPAPAVVGEGMSLCAVEVAGGDAVLVAFGGYNGACQQEVQAFRVPREFPASSPDVPETLSLDPAASTSSSSEPNSSLAADGKPPDADSRTAALAPDADSRTAALAEAPASAQSAAVKSSSEPDGARVPGSSDALTADNLRLRSENSQLRSENDQLREDARRVVQQQAALQARLEALEAQKTELEKKLKRRYVEDETAKVDHINREVDAMTRELDRVLATQTDHDRLQERVKELEGDVASANPGKGDGTADDSPPPKRGWFGL